MWNFSENLVILGCGHSASKYAVSEVNLHQSDHQQKDTFVSKTYILKSLLNLKINIFLF
jgi:hypothetical protein